MQRLVTIYLDTNAYLSGKWVANHADMHGTVEEHLKDELRSGWSVKTLCGMGGAGDGSARGWITVLLEKEE